MKDFEVAGVVCEVAEPLCISHTGSAPYSRDGAMVVEKNGTYRVVATYRGHIWSEVFNKNATEEQIREATIIGLTAAIERLDRKSA